MEEEVSSRLNRRSEFKYFNAVWMLTVSRRQLTTSVFFKLYSCDIQTHCSLFHLSSISSDRPPLFDRITELGAHRHCFLSGPQSSCLFFRSLPAPEMSSSPGLTCLPGQKKSRFNHPSIEEGMVPRSLTPKHSYCWVITQRVGSTICSASSACVVEAHTKPCFTFLKTWDRQLPQERT